MTGPPAPPASWDALLRDLAPDPCRVGWSVIDPATIERLTAGELAVVARAVPARRAEFATGRAVLRSVLGRDVEILRRPNGAPDLPADRAGSLAHDRGVVVAVVAPVAEVAAIGIDVEPDGPLESGVAELVVRPDDVVPDPLTAFVAKEATYKAWSWLGGGMLEHHDVRVEVHGVRFTADVRGEATIGGRVDRGAGRVVAVAVSPAR